MKTIPFDIKLRKLIQSEENRYTGRYKVQTKSGKPVRIICWDKEGPEYTIVALIENSSSYERTLSFNNDGRKYSSVESNDDLVLVDTWGPKFKVGDKVRYKNGDEICRIAGILNKHYHVVLLSNKSSILVPFKDDILLELVPEESEFEELGEFEEKLANYLYNSIGIISIDGMKALAKMIAPKLLKFAKKEIIKNLKDD